MKDILVGGHTTVNPENVVLLVASINYTVIHLSNGKKTIVATPLKTLEARFQPYDFYRTHKSFMVNLAYIKTYMPTHNKVEMVDNQKVLVSRRKANGLKRYLHQQSKDR
ncbi:MULTISPECIES: LytTR family DNA-binding domain-containing protein [Emticicia]|uniref:LytR/AlgR family response regulator transcription factor n=1 Tax=Emticicia TaxID=312278 RepID=UPI0007D8A932|nr:MULTISPECIES: LytTR family DNA-binding domain-containing protein [Emticicia]